MKKVIMYSTPTCVYCNMAKEFFKKNDVEFESIDLSVNTDKIGEMIEKSGQRGVPVIDIDGEVIVGFNKDKISNILGI